MTDPIELCLAGAISPQIALCRLVLAGVSGADLAARLAPHRDDPRAVPLLDVVAAHGAELAHLPTVFAGTGLDHDTTGPASEVIARLAAAYDVAVARSPEASVATYSLGHAGTLARATDEIVAWLKGADALPPGAHVLDIGCGIGRVAAALLPRAATVLGLDVSPGMVAEARRRHPDARLRFEVTAGTNLDGVPAGAFDLVLAADSFTYLVQAGVAAAHFTGAARALRPGGAFAILNFSYRGDPVADREDAARWSAACGLVVERAAETPFHLWDANAWLFRAPQDRTATA